MKSNLASPVPRLASFAAAALALGAGAAFGDLNLRGADGKEILL